MKYILFLLLIASCTNKPDDQPQPSSKMPESIHVYVINGCQYVVYERYTSDGGCAIVHAGNCNNPIHKYPQ